jgi:hypothetical protein
MRCKAASARLDGGKCNNVMGGNVIGRQCSGGMPRGQVRRRGGEALAGSACGYQPQYLATADGRRARGEAAGDGSLLNSALAPPSRSQRVAIGEDTQALKNTQPFSALRPWLDLLRLSGSRGRRRGPAQGFLCPAVANRRQRAESSYIKIRPAGRPRAASTSTCCDRGRQSLVPGT